MKLKPYRCTGGKLTIGYGRNLDDKGISIFEARELLENDIIEAKVAVGNIYGLDIFRVEEKRIAALIDMAFNLGEGGLRKFTKMNTAIKERDWEKAAKEAEDSRWYKQVPNRAKKIIKLLRGDEK